MATIPLVGLASNDPVPGNYIAVNFAQGQASTGTSDYSAILIGNKLSTGSASDSTVYGPDTNVQLTSEDEAIALFGAGSELHIMWRDFVAVNKSTSLYAVVVAESAGAQATGSITLSGTATANGTVRTIIGTKVIETGFITGDAYTAIASDVVTSINQYTYLPVVATANDGVVTITAKQKGPRGNFIRYSAQIIGSSTGVSVTPSTRTVCSDGTTADDNTNALAAIATTRYYYQVSAAEDTTQFGALVSQTDSNAAPITGIRSRAFCGAVGTVSATNAVAVARNAARAEIIWQENSDLTPAQLAVNAAACYSLFETSLGARSSLNYDFFGSDAITSQYWKVPAPLSGTKPSRANVKSALNNGVTPIAVAAGNRSYIVKRVTTRSLNGAVSDYRIRDAHKVTVCDRFADDLVALASASFSGKALSDDPLPGQRIPGAQVVTPTAYKILINQLVNEYADADLLQNRDQIKAGVQVVRETSPTTRLSARVPLQPIDILDSTATNVDQIA